jgi:hypothetical protein
MQGGFWPASPWDSRGWANAYFRHWLLLSPSPWSLSSSTPKAREQAATQRKLDEIVQALPGADNSLLMLEHASDDELRATRDSHLEIRRAALDERSGAPNSPELTVSEKRRMTR